MAVPLDELSPRPGPRAGDWRVPLVFALTLFTSAALLFVVQPLVSRMLLPLLGGSPSVWTTCMLFFQAALLTAYLYSHVVTDRLPLGRQLALHAVVLLVPIAALPLGVRAARWLPETLPPAAFALLVLALSVGLPFFAVATSAPLLQRWFSRTGHRHAADPYFLYAASNAGNLVGLIAYPLYLERRLALGGQSRAWALGYAVLLVLVAACGAIAWGGRERATPRATIEPVAAVGAWRRLEWLALAFVPSSLMLGVTTYITTDVAAVPLFWLPPLALYLASFVLAFSRPGRALQPVLRFAGPLAALALFALTLLGHGIALWQLILAHLAALFLIAAAYHGELARLRPAPQALTTFYLWLSLGGVAGGLFNAIVAPLCFSTVVEYPIAMALAVLLVPMRLRPIAAVPLAVGLAAIALNRYDPSPTKPVVHRERSFFGVLTVRADGDARELRHGTTIHGKQDPTPERRFEPSTYYHRNSPIADVFQRLGAVEPAPAVAVIGLGTGTLAAYARAGQSFTFYEIDRAVERISRDPRYFTYLSDAEERGARIGVVIGDARLTLRRAPSRRYGLVVVDAFSSDAIPVHLITREALALYLDKLAPGGLVAFHVSNRHLALEPVLAALARGAGLFASRRNAERSADPERFFGSDWVVLSRELSAVLPLSAMPGWHALEPTTEAPWTDDFSDVAGALKWLRASR